MLKILCAFSAKYKSTVGNVSVYRTTRRHVADNCTRHRYNSFHSRTPNPAEYMSFEVLRGWPRCFKWTWSIWWNENWQEKPTYSENPDPLPLCQVPHDLTWALTRAAAVGRRKRTAWAMARPFFYPDEGSSRFFWNACNYMLDFTTSSPKRWLSCAILRYLVGI
jgi:hypothetical protein